MHQSIRTARNDDPVLRTLADYFKASDRTLFEALYLWHYAPTPSRELTIIEAAADAYLTYQFGGDLPDFFLTLYAVMEACDAFTNEQCAPYSRMTSPEFWYRAFKLRFASEPTDGGTYAKKPDPRWDELFKDGMPMLRKLEEA